MLLPLWGLCPPPSPGNQGIHTSLRDGVSSPAHGRPAVWFLRPQGPYPVTSFKLSHPGSFVASFGAAPGTDGTLRRSEGGRAWAHRGTWAHPVSPPAPVHSPPSAAARWPLLGPLLPPRGVSGGRSCRNSRMCAGMGSRFLSLEAPAVFALCVSLVAAFGVTPAQAAQASWVWGSVVF